MQAKYFAKKQFTGTHLQFRTEWKTKHTRFLFAKSFSCFYDTNFTQSRICIRRGPLVDMTFPRTKGDVSQPEPAQDLNLLSCYSVKVQLGG